MTFRIILLVFLALAACTKKETSQNPHMPFQGEDGVPQISNRDCPDEISIGDHQLDLCTLEANYAEKVNDLSLLVLSDDFIKYPELYSSAKSQRLIWLFNRLVLKSSDKNLLKKYVDLITNDCNPEQLKDCRNYLIFSKASNTYDILKSFLASGHKHERINDLFLLAVSAKNRTTDHELMKIFAARSNEFKPDFRIEAVLRTHLNYENDLNANEQKKIRDYLSDDYEALSSNFTREEVENLISRLHKDIKTYSIISKANALTKERPLLVQALNLKKLSDTTLIKLLDLMFLNQIDTNNALNIFDTLGANDQLLTAFDQYLHWQTALKIQQADLITKDIVDRLDIQSSDLLLTFLDEVEPVRQLWRQHRSQVEFFTEEIARKNISKSTKLKIRQAIDGLNITIKTYSEYPHMFYLAYLLSKMDFSKTFHYFIWKFTIDSSQMFNEIFLPDGIDHSWFAYTLDDNVLPPLLVRNSLYFSIKSGLLNLMSIDQEEFINYIAKNLYNRYVDMPHTRINRVNQYLNASNAYKNFMRDCRALKKGRPIQVRLPFEEVRSSYYKDAYGKDVAISSVTLITMDNWNPGADNKGIEQGIIPYNSKIKDFYEYARVDLDFILKIFNTMKMGLNDISQQSAAINRVIKDVTAKKEYAVSSFKKWREVGPCLQQVFTEEKNIIDYLIKREKEFLKKVYNDIEKLNSPNIDAATASSIYEFYDSYSYLHEGIRQKGIKGLDKISKSGYHYSQFNFLGRIAHYLETHPGLIKFDIILPVNIEKSDYYHFGAGENRKIHLLPFTSKKDFIETAYRIMIGKNAFTSWDYNRSVIHALFEYLECEISLMRLDEVVPVNDFVNRYMDFLQYLKTPEIEQEVLDATSKIGFIDPIAFMDTFVQWNGNQGVINRTYGYYDWVIKYLNIDVLGTDQEVEDLKNSKDTPSIGAGMSSVLEAAKKHRKGIREQGRLLVETIHDLEVQNIFFPINHSMISAEYTELKKQVQLYENKVDLFLSEIKKRDYSDIEIQIYVDEVLTGPILLPHTENNYRATQREFHYRTKQCFKENNECF